MGLFRDESGRVIEIADEFGEARGYTPLTAFDKDDIYHQEGVEARGTERGAIGAASTAAYGLASGLTLGASDLLLSQTMTPLERERMVAEMDAHPYLRGASEIVGAVGGALATGGTSLLARTPAGYLGRATNSAVQGALAQGGVKGTAKALGYMGAEGAAQSAGQYIGHTALRDKEVTAEGLTGALGTGFAFGAAGGGAALGVVNGVVAGRRLYSRVMGGQKAADAAESSWSIASQQALEADTATARAAEVKLENIRVAKMEALRGRNSARSAAQEAALDAQGARMPKEAGDFEMGIKTDVIPEGVAPPAPEAGMPTSVFRRPGEAEGPMPLVDDLAQPQGAATSVHIKKPPVETTKVIPKGATDLEAQLAGTKAKLDEGASIKDIRPDPEFDAPGKTFGDREPDIRAQIKEMQRQGRTKETMMAARQETLSEIRYKATEDLLGPQLAKQEQILEELMEEFRAARKDFEELMSPGINRADADDFGITPRDITGFPATRHGDAEYVSAVAAVQANGGGSVSAVQRALKIGHAKAEAHIARMEAEGIIAAPDAQNFRRVLKEGDPVPVWNDQVSGINRTDPKTGGMRPGNRKAIEIVDEAHEEALLRAKFAADPQEAGRAITEAEELENLLEGLMTPRLHAPDAPMSRGELRAPQAKQWSEDLIAEVKKVERYEKASASLADEMADAAHPASADRTKVMRGAEKDSERKMYERTARATDDAADGIHPKKAAAKAARKAHIDAQSKLDELSAQHTEAKHDFSIASKKVREGEKAKKTADAADAKLASAAGKFGAADAGGWMELIDIPGMPKPSDLPIIGPLLGAFLMMRTLKKSMGRAMGKVPATADARVAVLASQTRDRVARAVDRSIGVLQRGAKAMTKVGPPVAGILAHRIYDDGGEDPGDDIQDQAAARMREITAYVHTPGAIERDVRRQLAEVTDPDLITAVEAQRRAGFEFLLSVMPKMPEPNLLNPVKYRPSGAQAMSFARSMDAVADPAGVFERLAGENSTISLEAAAALAKVTPRIFSEAAQRLMEQAHAGKLKVSMRTRVQLSLFYKVPLDAALDPVNLKITQSVYERKVTPPPSMQGAPAQPAIANPVNLSQGLTPAADRSR